MPYEPGPEIRELTAKCPVNKVLLPDDSTAWLVTGFHETREVMIDPRYSRALVFAPGRHVYGTEPTLADSLIGMDPPEHSRLRKLVSGAFTQKRIRVLRAQVAEIVDDLIDGMLAGPRPVDLVHSFSLMVPASVTCALLGVSAVDVSRFHALSNEIFGDWSRSPDDIARAYTAMAVFMAQLIAQKRRAPEDDLISMLVDPDSADRLSDVELIKFCVGLLAAGHETTSNSISMSFLALCRHPDELARLRADPDLIPGAVEELLRYVIISGSGFVPLARITREEVCLGGVTIPAGEIVLPTFDVANRDRTVFDDPDRLDVGRAPKVHLGFGAGAHHCLGAQLARLQLQEAFRGLLTRLPGLRVTVPMSALEIRSGHRIANVRELPVTWDDV
ncbi:cytochrome P450 [Saccharothrix ecbatanensis]|uniref:Cytochrome P450 n=1 Tax=Saccharothrix ecbatanensis TaxID=1105145 RepID=A0A7W9HHA1_9PSEU|nr:cytochrome P450 [Saccharothrix ecbatanensis]MBB5801938.1 cytochrome P450 [Saccharothrix ecbatanensis]